MASVIWQDIVTLVSAIACVGGFILLFGFRYLPEDELESVDQALFAMIFGYWMIHCLAIAVGRSEWIENEFLLRSLRATSAFSYFLTWASVLSLPLHRISVRETE